MKVRGLVRKEGQIPKDRYLLVVDKRIKTQTQQSYSARVPAIAVVHRNGLKKKSWSKEEIFYFRQHNYACEIHLK